MSHFINPIFLPNKEDWELYGQTSCTLKHWPDMWEGEIAAEAALYRERINRTFYTDWDYPLSHRRNRTRSHNPVIVALVQLADEGEWREVFKSPQTGKAVYRIK